MKWNKVLALALSGVLSLGLLSACSGGTTSQPSTAPSAAQEDTDPVAEPSASGAEASFTTIEDGKLIMSTNAQFPPYEMVADGEGVEGTGFEGIDIEIALALADKLGLELVIDDMEFDSALLAVQNNAADMMLAGLSYSKERDQVVDFSDPYATGVQVVIVKEGSDVTLDNLGEKMIGTQRGTTGNVYASYPPEEGGYGEDHVVAYDNGITAVQALMNGQVDCVIIDNGPAQEFVNANPGLTILETPWVEESYAIGLTKGNTALNEAITNALNELIADGTVQSIIDSYISAE